MVIFTRPGTLTTLLCAIILYSCSVRAQTPAATESQEINEAQRLQSILRRYYDEEAERESERAAGIARNAEIVGPSGEAYSPQQVLLNGAQGVLALQTISQRLADASIPAQRRSSDIIFHAEVRRDGTLLSSKSHSLRPLGKSQYVGKISLAGGEVEITVREQQWSLLLPVADSADYIVTLSTLRDQQHEFHVIAVAELLGTNRSDFPAWLPPIGVASNATTGS
jgi:hypothetical protein